MGKSLIQTVFDPLVRPRSIKDQKIASAKNSIAPVLYQNGVFYQIIGSWGRDGLGCFIFSPTTSWGLGDGTVGVGMVTGEKRDGLLSSCRRMPGHCRFAAPHPAHPEAPSSAAWQPRRHRHRQPPRRRPTSRSSAGRSPGAPSC